MSLDIPSAEGAYRRALARSGTGGTSARRCSSSSATRYSPRAVCRRARRRTRRRYPSSSPPARRVTAALAMVQLSRAFWRHGKTERAREVSARRGRAARGRAAAPALSSPRSDGRARRVRGTLGGGDRVGEQGHRPRERDPVRERHPRSGDAWTRASRSRRPGGLDDLALGASSLALELDLPAEDTAIAIGNFGSMVSLDRRRGSRPRGHGGESRVRAFARSRPPRHVHAHESPRAPLPRGALGRAPRGGRRADRVGSRAGRHAARAVGARPTTRSCSCIEGRSARAARPRRQPRCLEHAEVGDPQTVLPLARDAALLRRAREPTSRTADGLLAEYEAVSPGRARESSRTTRVVWLAMRRSRRRRSRPSRDAAERTRAVDGARGSTRSRTGARSSPRRRAEPTRPRASSPRPRKAGRTWGSVPLRAYALVGLGNCAGDAAALAEGMEIFAQPRRDADRQPVAPTASAAGVGAGRRRALLGLGQLGGRERGAVEDVALGHLDLVETVGTSSPRAARSRRRRSRTRGRARFPKRRCAARWSCAASRSSCSSTEASERRWPCVRAGSYSASPRSSVASVVTVPATPIALAGLERRKQRAHVPARAPRARAATADPSRGTAR